MTRALSLTPSAWRGAVLPLALLAGWVLAVDSGWFTSPLLVPLAQVVTAPFTDPDGREIWGAIGWSLLRVTAGVGIGASIGIALGIGLSLWHPAQRAVSPTIHGLRQIALFAWIPLLTSWFGNGEVAKIVFISLSACFPAFLNTEQGVRTISPALREVADLVRLSPWQTVTRLVLPGAAPAIFIGLEIALLTAWIGTVGAEYAIGVGGGIGSFLVAAREGFRMDLVLVGVIALAAIGYAFSRLARGLFTHFVPWQTRP
jgi:sulfonate transport system permease protein